MRVLFLDIDGVLNHHGVYQECSKRKGKTIPCDWVDPTRVALLNEICERTGAVVVISSSWREYLGGWPTVQEVLVQRGFTGQVVDHTIMLRDRMRLNWLSGTRWDEINYWLTWHPEVTQWVVLEDALIDGIPPERLIHTNLTTGLTREGVERAVTILRMDACE